MAQRAARAESFALVGATVIDVRDGQHLARTTIIVSGGRLAAVGVAPAVRVPRGMLVIDATGTFVIPGLWDMHVEQALPVWEAAPVDSNARLFHPLFLAHGVTGVRDVAGPPPVLRRWLRDIEEGRSVGPRMVFTGPKLAPRTTNAARRVSTRADVAATASTLRLAGARSIYISGIADSLHSSLVATMRAAGVDVEGTLSRETSLWTAAERGQRAVDHFDGVMVAVSSKESWVRRLARWREERPFWLRVLWKLRLVKPFDEPAEMAARSWSEERTTALGAHLARHGVYLIPTLRLLGTLTGAGDSLVRLPPAPLELRPPRSPWNGWERQPVDSTHPQGRMWRAVLRSVAIMQRTGVQLLAASDAPNLYAAPGVGLHDELGLLVRAGLTPLQALRAATLTPAEYLGATDSLGTVGEGRVADLVVLDADPTVDIANSRLIRAVVARGRYLDRSALDSLHALGVARAAEVERYWNVPHRRAAR